MPRIDTPRTPVAQKGPRSARTWQSVFRVEVVELGTHHRWGDLMGGAVGKLVVESMATSPLRFDALGPILNHPNPGNARRRALASTRRSWKSRSIFLTSTHAAPFNQAPMPVTAEQRFWKTFESSRE